VIVVARSAIGSGPRFVHYTLALFKVSPLHIMWIIEYFTPRPVQGSLS
jgi:hypothetical protein